MNNEELKSLVLSSGKPFLRLEEKGVVSEDEKQQIIDFYREICWLAYHGN